MKVIGFLLVFSCCIKGFAQIDTTVNRKQLYDKLNASTNYIKLSNYYCSDQVIDGGCYVQLLAVTTKLISTKIDFESGGV